MSLAIEFDIFVLKHIIVVFRGGGKKWLFQDGLIQIPLKLGHLMSLKRTACVPVLRVYK
jgi:hypothetical protein